MPYSPLTLKLTSCLYPLTIWTEKRREESGETAAMEATLLSGGNSTLSILSVSKSLNSHSNPLIAHYHRSLCPTRHSQLAHLQLRLLGSSVSWFGSGSLVRGLGSVDMRRTNLQYAPSSAVSFAYGGGGFGGGNAGGGGGGGGDGSTQGGGFKPRAVTSGAGDASVLSSDVIILDVRGMTCGGCAASVKRILESQPQVSTASVNLTTETAIVWPVSEVMVAPNWKKDVGEALAKHLTTCGFKSNLRDQGDIEKNIQS